MGQRARKTARLIRSSRCMMVHFADYYAARLARSTRYRKVTKGTSAFGVPEALDSHLLSRIERAREEPDTPQFTQSGLSVGTAMVPFE